MTEFVSLDDIFKNMKEDTDVEDIIDKNHLQDRTIFLEGDIDEETINIVIRRLLFLSKHSKKDITIRLCTDGGDCYESVRLYDAIRGIKNKVHIIASGRVFSAGVFILATCCTGVRTTTKNTSFMSHEVSSWSDGKLSDMKIGLKEIERIQNVMNSLMAKHTNLTVKDVEALDVKDNYFDAKKAKKLGIVDRIV
jgi:ATP-dependent Clp protease protease subunit